MLQQYIIVYDISDPKRWRKIYKTMKDYGYRVQYSVFEAQMTRENMLLLKHKLEQFMNKQEDSLIIYRNCNRCTDQTERIGKQYAPMDDEDWYFV